MVKTKTILEVKKGERIYSLELDPNSPLGEIFDALAEMQFIIMNKMKESQPKPKSEEV